MATPIGPVQFPKCPVDQQGDDLGQPITNLLRSLNVLADPTEFEAAGSIASVLAGPPPSVAIIEAGATALSKWWAVGLGAGLSFTTIVAAFKGFWSGESDPIRIAVTASSAAVIGVLAIAIAMIVGSDLRARQTGAVAQYQVRAEVTKTFLMRACTCDCTPGAAPLSQPGMTTMLLAALGQPAKRVKVTLRGGWEDDVDGLRYTPAGEAKMLISGRWIDLDEVQSFATH